MAPSMCDARAMPAATTLPSSAVGCNHSERWSHQSLPYVRRAAPLDAALTNADMTTSLPLIDHELESILLLDLAGADEPDPMSKRIGLQDPGNLLHFVQVRLAPIGVG
jgi:hypothetical protein